MQNTKEATRTFTLKGCDLKTVWSLGNGNDPVAVRAHCLHDPSAPNHGKIYWINSYQRNSHKTFQQWLDRSDIVVYKRDSRVLVQMADNGTQEFGLNLKSNL